MKPRVVAQFLAAAVVAAGLTACTTGAVRPAVPLTEATPGSNDVLVGAWSSTTDGAAHIEDTFPVTPPPEVPRPEGYMFHFRARCAGDGTVSFRVSAKSGFTQTHECECIGKWAGTQPLFPRFDDDPESLGPFSLTVDRAAGVTSWDVEAYATRISNRYPKPSASPT
ncbi:hypothetical protein OHA72_49430 [Dactylosporangium sp. NBC_01737]|uniref:hypothetical protein n=1 Tax=Dactylosporangium sp. NBC_01737 TaxID=2975959 RepID=UPI002E12107A|nr:hypothetical protein OHA72_49430 [Dactylosporangium sp. NBC_01737]